MLTPSEILALLNELVAIDAKATAELIEKRVPVSEKILEHRSIVPYAENDLAPPQLGVLGVLNGIFGLVGKRLVGVYTDDGVKLLYFQLRDSNGRPSVQGPDRPELREESAGSSACRPSGV